MILSFRFYELFIVTIIPMGSINAMWRYLPGEKEINKKHIISSAFMVIVLSGIFITLLLTIFQNSISVLLNIPKEVNILNLVFISCFLQSVSHFIYWVLQYKNKAFFYLTLSFLQFLFLVSLTIYLIIEVELGLVGIYYAKIYVYSILCIFMLFYLFKSSFTLPSLKHIQRILTYGIPIVPMRVARQLVPC